MSYYVVTGAAGFIGSRLVAALNRRGIKEIIAVDNLTQSSKFTNLAGCDIADYVDQAQFIAKLDRWEGAVEAVFHQGACSDTMESDGRFMMENNYEYSRRLLDWCQEEMAPFIYASCLGVRRGPRLSRGAALREAAQCLRLLQVSLRPAREKHS